MTWAPSRTIFWPVGALWVLDYWTNANTVTEKNKENKTQKNMLLNKQRQMIVHIQYAFEKDYFLGHMLHD